MHLSFNGAIKLYTYNCPYAYKLRVIDNIYITDVLPKTQSSGEDSAAKNFGIDQHKLVAEYISGHLDQFDYATNTIEHLRATNNVSVEITKYLSLDFEPLKEPPKSSDFISYRPDAVEFGTGFGKIYDFKFGDPDYGHTIWYSEIEFFLFGESLHYPDIGQWSLHVHFPVADYTLPVRHYDIHKIAKMQTKWIWYIEKILNDKFYTPKPSKVHCRFCDYRRIEHGGCGVCEHSVD